MNSQFWSVVAFIGDELDNLEHDGTLGFSTQEEARVFFLKQEERLENLIKKGDFKIAHIRRMCHTFEQNIDISEGTGIDSTFSVFTELTSTFGMQDGVFKRDSEFKHD